MITASHNPYRDNGIKVINEKGHKLEEEIEEKIEAYIDGEIPELPYATGENLGGLVKHSFKGKKIALDMSNGSASRIAGKIFEKLGAEVHTTGDTPDGMNINRHCGSTHIENLQELVKNTGADAGFAYDGDADRCIAVNEKGEVVTGDHIM